ncbi:MAG: DUF1854 domain-containing protein [Pelomonas sp.]|nr:DUF1854 domain-containing protein [Roseateles sp.]
MPNFELRRTVFGRLVLVDAAGVEHVGVQPVRAHPISAPDEGIALIGPDGHELAWIANIDELPAPQRELVQAELGVRELVPVVERIVSVSTFATPSQWTVQTDRGETQFILKSEDDIRRLGEGRLLIGSGHGIHFMVPDRFALDRHSRRLLERFL